MTNSRRETDWVAGAAVVGDEAGLGDPIGIAQPAAGDNAGTAARLETPAIEISGRRGAGVADDLSRSLAALDRDSTPRQNGPKSLIPPPAIENIGGR